MKVVGFVNSAPTFTDQPAVVNGVSDLFVEVFGDRGKHTRSAVGMSQCPGEFRLRLRWWLRLTHRVTGGGLSCRFKS